MSMSPELASIFSGLARKFDHVSLTGSVPTQNSFLSVNDPERPSTVYSNQRAEQESSANAHTMGRHFTRVAIYSRISNDPPRHQAGGVRRHLPEGRRKQAGLLLRRHGPPQRGRHADAADQGRGRHELVRRLPPALHLPAVDAPDQPVDGDPQW